MKKFTIIILILGLFPVSSLAGDSPEFNSGYYTGITYGEMVGECRVYVELAQAVTKTNDPNIMQFGLSILAAAAQKQGISVDLLAEDCVGILKGVKNKKADLLKRSK